MAEKSIKAAQVQTLINNIKQRFFSKAEARAISFMGETQVVGSADIGGGVTEITYSELKTLRDEGRLQAGNYYRITDYVATTNGSMNYDSWVTSNQIASANHPFDIIVQALTNNTLSEEARAALHSGDTYFANSNLSAWRIWYKLDNSSCFCWAANDGKGVIYRMIDEYQNDMPFDFKGLRYNTGFYFIRDASDSDALDGSLTGYFRENTVKPYIILSDNYGTKLCIPDVQIIILASEAHSLATEEQGVIGNYIGYNANNVYLMSALHNMIGNHVEDCNISVGKGNCIQDGCLDVEIAGEFDYVLRFPSIYSYASHIVVPAGTEHQYYPQ